MSRPIIEVRHLAKRYNLGAIGATSIREEFHRYWDRFRGVPHPDVREFWALRDVSFDVQPGEVVGVIGRNGAGKSTLLKILSRITEPTSGYAKLRGRVASLLEVGTGFHPELTGRENVFLNGAILGMTRPEVRRKFDEIVAFAEVEQFIDTPVKHYSSGMYVRLAFAVAAHLEPEILIIDEVLAVGDTAFQKKCIGKMQDVSEGEGRTVLFVSHNMTAVHAICSRAIWLNQGFVRRDGPVSAVALEYFDVSISRTPERTWSNDNAPGDDRVRLRGARILQRNKASGMIDINQPAQVEIDFEILRSCRNLIAGLNFLDSTGICLFAHCDWRPNELSPGRYRKHVDLPRQLFAEGCVQITIQLVFHDPMILSVIQHEALGFEAVDSDTPDAVRGLFHGHWPGVMRLSLQWSEARPLV